MSAPVASYGYITSRTNELRALVRQYRANEVALRRLHQSRPVRNQGATDRAITLRLKDRYNAEASLVVDGKSLLAGWLVEERDVNARLGRARRAGIARPELVKRLTTARKAIKAELKRLGK